MTDDVSRAADTAHTPATHFEPVDRSDRIALRIVKFMRFFADKFFAGRYGHRAVVLETVAAVPGMVGGLLQHLKALRHIRDDQGWIKELIEEADNERMHLMTFIKIAQPSRLSDIWRKKRSQVTHSIWNRSTQVLLKTSPRRSLRLITGNCQRMRACVRL